MRPALLLALALALIAPGAAIASPGQFSIIQDDATFLGVGSRDPNVAMAEAKALGADAVRVSVSWYTVSPDNRARVKPAGFNLSDPDDPGYDWGIYDAFVARAKRNGLRVLLMLAPPIPFWASEEPSRCPHRIGGYANLGRSCMWKPEPKLFGQFAGAVARRYRGKVAFYSPLNEPNLEHYLYPQLQRTRAGIVDVAARRYRELWIAAHKAIARNDPGARGRVLFGETAAISSPIDTLYAALCLDPQGKPFKGRLRALQGCRQAARLPIGGVAVHPYNKDAVGSVFKRSHTTDSLPLAQLRRLHGVMDRAVRLRRIPARRKIFVTEFGFQSMPPKPAPALALDRHAAALNEAERLFFADRRVASVAQYELYDVGLDDPKAFNTGLRAFDGKVKPAWAAWRMPIVVTRLSAGEVEVWGQVRPASGPVRPSLALRAPGEAGFTQVATPQTNRAGYFRLRIRRPGAAAARWRAQWTRSGGETIASRTARAGKPIVYSER